MPASFGMGGLMAIVDWCFVAVLLASIAWGALRGWLYEVLSLVNYLVALGLAQWLAPLVQQRLQITGAGESARYAAGFALVFVGSVVVGALFSKLHQKFFQTPKPKSADRLLGSVVGLVIGSGVLLVATLIMDMTPLATRASWQASTGVGISTATLLYLKPLFSEQLGLNLLPGL